MCTVTYIPAAQGFILTHNRDEAPGRSPLHIDTAENDHSTLVFPRDTKAGGTWIAAANYGQTACVLNGAFVKHRHQPPYKRSRGLVMLDFFAFPGTDAFLAGYDFEGIEPFTLLNFKPQTVQEIRWDGAKIHRADLPPEQAHFWCSATLYPPGIQEKREQVFIDWLQEHPEPTVAELLLLHKTGSIGDPENDYVMNRDNRVRTVSITQIVCKEQITHMRYEELLTGTVDKKNVGRRPPPPRTSDILRP